MTILKLVDNSDMSHSSLCVVLSGGIAVLKTLDALRLLMKDGIGVEVVMTRAAEQFVTPLTVGALTQNPPHRDMFDVDQESTMRHIELSRRHDAVLVAPATANRLAKMAHGIADDLAGAVLMASNKPLLVAPAMNHHMWSHPATQRNLARIEEDGATIIQPEIGEMACQEFGVGRLVEPAILAQQVKKFLASISCTPSFLETLAHKHVLVTSGPTIEPIDPVRYLTNHSSGKQGYAIAQAAQEAGAKVTLISGPTSLETPKGVRRINVMTAQEMHDAVFKQLPVDVAIMVAAVADFRVVTTEKKKIKKATLVGDKKKNILSLASNPDILFDVAHCAKRPQIVVGFAAETHNLIEEAKRKRADKKCDIIVANAITKEESVFGADENTVYFVSDDNVVAYEKAAKKQIARDLIVAIAKRIHKAP